MSYRAWTFIGAVLLVATVLSLLALPGVEQTASEWFVFTILTIFAVVAQHFEATNGRKSYYPHFVFFLAGVFLLHPFLFVLLVVIPHVVEWVYKRLTNSPLLRQWYIQPFNIATFLLAGFAAQWVYARLHQNELFYTPVRVLMVLMVALIYVGVNHLLIGLVLLLARHLSLHDSGVLSLESVLPDIILASLGYVTAVLWSLDPWLVLPALSPLFLMYEALKVPQLKQEAQTDSKTGLLNARHFNSVFTSELDRAIRFNRPLAFIMADLDLMRNINNTYGHLAGDAVLAGVGKIIQSVIRDYDSGGRFGGEEFAIVMPETTLEGALSVAERLRVAIAGTKFAVEGSSSLIEATMSFGVACFPQDATTTTTLTQAADIAVYQAKHRGRNRVVLYRDVSSLTFVPEAQYGEPLVERRPLETSSLDISAAPSIHAGSFSLELELRRALERDEFVVYYQPKFKLTTGEIEGLEALVRWQHPTLGLVSPENFIEAAEKTGLISHLDFSVLKKACLQLGLWNRARVGQSPLVLSVNFSAQDFQQPELIEKIEQVLKETGVEASWLEIEITESALIDTLGTTHTILTQIKGLGIHLAIDDFGTGYSSLSYLKNLPVDVLKIDGKFIAGLESNTRNAIIVSAVVNLGHSLELAVVAEGVENIAEMRHLQSLGCDLGQGFYFSKPLPFFDMDNLLNSATSVAVLVE